jgi:hypothetical protein
LGAQCHPSSVIGCQFPDAARYDKNDCRVTVRLRSGTDPGVTTGVYRVRRLCLVLRTCRLTFSTHWNPFPLSCGNHFHVVPRSASCLPAQIVCLEPRVLSLNPHVVFSCSDGRPGPLTVPSATSELIACIRSSPVSRRLPGDWLIPRQLKFLFPPPVATPVGSDG